VKALTAPMHIVRVLLLLALLPVSTAMAQSRPKALFYMTENTASIRSFLEHADKVDILVPTWYSVDDSGLVWGGPDELVLKTAREHHVPVMPIIINANIDPKLSFSQEGFHKLATDAAVRAKLASAMLRECKKHGYIGFQFDFENVAWTDGDVLTQLVTESAVAMHKAGFQLSIATVPNAPGYPGQGGFARWIYANWRGAYDLKALATKVDLICLMTYDQHTSYTPPGPVAGYRWTVENLDDALKYVPREKLSLGIPLYGYHWQASDPGKENRPAETAASVGSEEVQRLIATYAPQQQWDSEDRTPWFYFYRDNTREWVFYTDARSFAERLSLVRERGIEGFCSWVLGQEDPAIWRSLPVHQ
jgi:spore germination protein YaaH